MPRQPLYPRIPNRKTTRLPDDRLRFLPDSPEVLAQTVNNTGYREKLASVFREAIARAKGAKSW